VKNCTLKPYFYIFAEHNTTTSLVCTCKRVFQSSARKPRNQRKHQQRVALVRIHFRIASDVLRSFLLFLVQIRFQVNEVGYSDFRRRNLHILAIDNAGMAGYNSLRARYVKEPTPK